MRTCRRMSTRYSLHSAIKECRTTPRSILLGVLRQKSPAGFKNQQVTIRPRIMLHRLYSDGICNYRGPRVKRCKGPRNSKRFYSGGYLTPDCFARHLVLPTEQGQQSQSVGRTRECCEPRESCNQTVAGGAMPLRKLRWRQIAWLG